jgi:molybdenum ABC transporter molybdate-binding protein
VAYVAPAVRVPAEAIARDYEAETGRRVELRFGASEDILTKAGMVNPSDPADLFLPADESYIQMARERGLVAEQVPAATMRAVVLTAKGNPKGIAAWPDLLRDGVKVAVPNPAAAVGKLTRDHLAATGRWAALLPHAVDTGTVTEAANAARVGSVDAAMVWDAVAANYPGQEVLLLPELAGVTARVEVAVLSQSADPAAALRFARYATADRGLRHFRVAGFAVLDAKSGTDPRENSGRGDKK